MKPNSTKKPVDTSPMLMEMVKAWLIDRFCDQVVELHQVQCEVINN